MNEVANQASNALSVALKEIIAEHPHLTHGLGYATIIAFGVVGLVGEIKAATA